MNQYHLLLAFRSILKRKFISLVIIVSLTLGLVCSFYITGFTYNELTVDGFNKNKDRIFSLLSEDPWLPEKKISMIADGVPQFLTETYPEVIDYCQVWNQSTDKIKIGSNNYFSEFKIIEASPSFFTFFSFPLISGNEKDVLNTNQKIVVSKAFALKYFGNLDVVGKSIEMNKYGIANNIFTISGVVDNGSVSSHLSFDMVLSNNERDIRASLAYLLLDKSSDPDAFGKKLIKDKKSIPALFENIPLNYYLESLKNIYFQPYWESKIIKSRNLQYIYVAVIIGIMVLLVACFNYFNLILYQLIDRTKEIAIKKVIGAGLLQSGRQLVTESILLIGISILLAGILLKQSILFFNRLTESDYHIADFFHTKVMIVNMLILILIGILSWLFIYKSVQRQKSAGLLNSTKKPIIKRQNFPVLILFQFTASVILIISTLTIMKQVYYIHNKDIGIDKSVYEIRMGSENGIKSLAFRDELLKISAISDVSVSEGSPLQSGAKVLIDYMENGVKKVYTPSIYSGDNEYLNVLGIKLLDGKYFSNNPKNNSHKCIINKALSDFFGLKDPIGKLMPGTNNEIIGVTDNFLWSSLENPVEPAYITYSESGSDILVKLKPELHGEGINQIKQCWVKLFPGYPMDYTSIGEHFNLKHKKQEHLVRLITTFCFLSIFISLIGLLALSLFSIQKRTKEIGIRKVNGAKIAEVMSMLNKDFVKWVAIAFIFACPIGWYAMDKWLQNFAYKTTLSWWVFAGAGAIAMVIALLTVSWQSWRAATRNPVEALRYE